MQNKNSPPLLGRVVYFLGSSITRGELTGGLSFVEHFRDATGAATRKEAVSGTTLAVNGDGSSYVERLYRFDFAPPPTALVVQLSTNDFSRNVALGDIQSVDSATVIGAIRHISRHTKECARYAAVYFYTCPMTTAYPHYRAYADFVKLFCDKIAPDCGIGVINFFDLYNKNPEERFLGNDGFHPTEAGYKLFMTPIITKRLTKDLM